MRGKIVNFQWVAGPSCKLPRNRVYSCTLDDENDQGSKAVQEQMQRLRPHLRALPFALLPLELLSKLMCIIPANVVLALFAVLLSGQGNSFHPGVAHWYIGAQLIAQVSIVSLSHSSSAVRARIVILFMAILTAIGSELWN